MLRQCAGVFASRGEEVSVGKATLLHITQWGDPTLGGEGRGRWLAEMQQTTHLKERMCRALDSIIALWLSRLYGLPNAVMIGMGIANVAHGLFSFSLAQRQTRRGLAQLLLESVFVGGLAALEWRHREVLSVAP